MTAVRRLVGAGLALGLALALALGATRGATATPRITTEGGAPLPDPFRRALPAKGPGAVASISYKAMVFARLEAVNRVGETVMGMPGAAGIHFVVGDDGALLEAAVTRPSGDPAFDANVIAMVRKAAPFPPPPPGAERAFDATIRFQAGHKP